MGESIRIDLIRCGESKTNGVQFGRGHVFRSFTREHIGQHTTLQITKEN